MWDGDHLWTIGRLVAVLGSAGKLAKWQVVDEADSEFAGGPDAQLLGGWAKNGRRITGDRVISAADGNQVIDGEVRGYLGDDAVPWIIARGVDSTTWEIETDDSEALNRLKGSLREVVVPPGG